MQTKAVLLIITAALAVCTFASPIIIRDPQLVVPRITPKNTNITTTAHLDRHKDKPKVAWDQFTCGGSSMCNGGSGIFYNDPGQPIEEILGYMEGMDDTDVFYSAEHIACSAFQYCCFIEGGDYGGLKGAEVRKLVTMIRDRGCENCGRIGIAELGNPNRTNGVLKIDVVAVNKGGCKGFCRDPLKLP